MITQKTKTSYNITSKSNWTLNTIVWYSIISILIFINEYCIDHNTLKHSIKWAIFPWCIWVIFDFVINIKFNKETTFTVEE